MQIRVLVQQLGSRLFLRSDHAWVGKDAGPLFFPDVITAISFCIQHAQRDVRLVAQSPDSSERFFYPFGQDPAIARQRRELRQAVRVSRRLKKEQQLLRARLDLLQAEGKDLKKQFPFFKRTLRLPRQNRSV